MYLKGLRPWLAFSKRAVVGQYMERSQIKKAVTQNSTVTHKSSGRSFFPSSLKSPSRLARFLFFMNLDHRRKKKDKSRAGCFLRTSRRRENASRVTTCFNGWHGREVSSTWMRGRPGCEFSKIFHRRDLLRLTCAGRSSSPSHMTSTRLELVLMKLSI